MQDPATPKRARLHSLDELTAAYGDRWEITLAPSRFRRDGDMRYTAKARDLATPLQCVVTSDPAELAFLLGGAK